MKTEFEVKILDIDVADVERKLLAIGARQLGVKRQRRYVYDLALGKHAWLRLRDDGKRTTLAVKEIHDDSIEGTKELEIVVDSFEKTAELLTKLGHVPKAYQENRRTSFVFDGIEFEIDEWPRIPVYLEIEGRTREDVERGLALLGYTLAQATSINTIGVYAKYGIDLAAIKELRF